MRKCERSIQNQNEFSINTGRQRCVFGYDKIRLDITLWLVLIYILGILGILKDNDIHPVPAVNVGIV